jgi:hypothetical protein
MSRGRGRAWKISYHTNIFAPFFRLGFSFFLFFQAMSTPGWANGALEDVNSGRLSCRDRRTD